MLTGAAVIEICPVSIAQAGTFLSQGQHRGADRWLPVMTHLRENPDGVLARVLSTPLMVYLARTAYQANDADPAELVGFGDAAALEQHLLATYVPAVYAAPARYPVAQAETWLATLAGMATCDETSALRWWLMTRPGPQDRPWTVFAAHLVHALACGLAAGGVVGLTGAVVAVSLLGTAEEGTDAVRRALWTGLLVGVGEALVLAPFVAGRAALRTARSRRPGATGSRPRRLGVRPGRLVPGLFAGAGLGWLLATFIDARTPVSFPVSAGVLFGLVLGLIAGLTGRVPDDDVAGPRSSLAGDGWALAIAGFLPGVVVCLAISIPFVLLTGTPDARLIAVLGGVVPGTLITSSLVAESAWLWFAVGRTGSALRRRLPWHLVAFLEDAHRRGVLRAVGPVYQFRHRTLQRYLAVSRAGS